MSRLDDFEEILNSVQGRKVNDSFDIKEFSDFYTIHGINYCGKSTSYDISKAMITDEPSEQTRGPNNFIPTSASSLYAICKTLYTNRDCEKKELVEKVRRALDVILVNPTTTFSKILYDNGNDEVIHDYKQKTQKKIKLSLTGPDGNITEENTQAEACCQALLDTTDSAEEINDVFQWITNQETYIQRFPNPGPMEPTMVCFRYGTLGFLIDTCVSWNFRGNAIGVRLYE